MLSALKSGAFENWIVHVGPIGNLGRRAVISDDILDTGVTREIDIMVTYGAFSAERWKGLCGLGVKWIFCAGWTRGNYQLEGAPPA
jgi:hypothetical protein